MTLRLLPLLGLLALLAAAPAGARTWIDTEGRPLEGEFVQLTGQSVQIRLAAGEVVNIHLSSLSKVDQEFVKGRAMTAKADLVAIAVRRIDAAVEEGLAKQKAEYNEGLNEHMFLRRIYLDLAGRIPSYAEVTSYHRSRESDKRQKLIMQLLASRDYASHNYNYFAEILRIQSAFPGTVLRNDAFIHWIKEQIHTNRPYDEMVRDMITAEGRIWENPAVGYHLRDNGMKLDHVSFMGKIFLGTDITCAQCHDDPFSSWTQYQYYELSAYLADLETQGAPPKAGDNEKPKGKAKGEASPDGEAMMMMSGPPNRKELETYLARKHQLDPAIKAQADQLNNLVGRYERALRDMSTANQLAVHTVANGEMRLPPTYEYDDARPNELVQPHVLFGKETDSSGAFTPRERLAAWLTSPDNERFAMNIANRMWARFMGRGAAEPLHNIDPRKVDNPALLQVLTEEMLTLDFDLKAFSWAIVNTKAYNRLATRTKVPVTDPYFFPGPLLRRMSAEQIWDSLITLMLDDPMEYRLHSGESYNRLINVINPRPGSIEDTVARIEDYYRFSPERAIVNAEGVPILEAKPKEREKAFGLGLSKRPDGPSDEEMMADFLRTAKEKGILLARASELPQPADPSHFLSKFGQSQRTFVIGASSLDGSVPQVMELMNGYATEALTRPGSRIFLDMKNLRSNFEKADVVFLSLLSRPAQANEQHLLDSELRADNDEILADLIWALLNTPEFLFIK